MTELLTPPGMTLETAVRALTRMLPVRDGARGEADRTFFDTFDGLLHAAGLSAVHERGALALVERDAGGMRAGGRAGDVGGMRAGGGAGGMRRGDGAGDACGVRAWASVPLPVRPLLVDELESGPLREALHAVVGPRALLALVHVRSHVRELGVLDDERKTIVRLTAEAPALVSASGSHRPLRPRVRLDLVRGYEEELLRLRERLLQELAFVPVEQPLVDEALETAGRDPGGAALQIEVALRGEQRADEASAAVLRRLLEVIEANFEGGIADIDSEFLHDLRVSVRRSRTVQRQFKGVFPPVELAQVRAGFRRLQQVTGDTRDLDVYVLDFDAMGELVPESMRADLEPLLGVLRHRRRIARREMVRALREDRTGLLLAGWASLLGGLVELPADGRPDAGAPIGALAGERIRKVYRRMVKMGRAIDPGGPPQAYHDLRKQGKELRYLLELFGASLYPADVVKPMIKSLKALQDTLGRHQDREVQREVLRSLRDEVAALPGGPGALMAMGALVERLGEDERAARAEFAQRFAAFAEKAQRKRVKRTFG